MLNQRAEVKHDANNAVFHKLAVAVEESANVGSLGLGLELRAQQLTVLVADAVLQRVALNRAVVDDSIVSKQIWALSVVVFLLLLFHFFLFCLGAQMIVFIFVTCISFVHL